MLPCNRYTSWISLKEMIQSNKIYCVVQGLIPQKARYHCLTYIPADWSIRLEFSNNEAGGLDLHIRGILKEAGSANSDATFNTNNVATLYLNKLKVQTLQPHQSLAGFNYPFGIIVFSHIQLSVERYGSLVRSIMPSILHKFLTLYNHTIDSLNILQSPSKSQAITGNTVQYQPAYSTNFLPATTAQSIPSTAAVTQSQHTGLIDINQPVPSQQGPSASQAGLSYNQATGKIYFFQNIS